MLIILPGLPPSKKNSKRVFRRNGKTVVLPSKSYEDWHKVAMVRMSGLYQFDNPVYIHVLYRRKSKRKRDMDNMLSSILDALVDAGILVDDSMDHVMDIRMTWETATVDETRIDIF